MKATTAIPKNRAPGSALVLDGSEVKLRLLAERSESKSVVHIDWVRFTALLRNAPTPDADVLFPIKLDPNIYYLDELKEQAQRITKLLKAIPDEDFSAASQAHELALKTAQALGPEFSVVPEVRKGHDFYKFRWAIERKGAECGWVGFLSSSDSPRQQSQSKTIHANLFGAACTFADAGWNHRVADVIDEYEATVTRTDLALDFFDGLPGGLDGIVKQYQAGVCDVNGRKLKSNCVGDWLNGRERSLYFGSKEAGKQTNCYEKGHQLFGVNSGSDWLRVELRWGNKLRVLCSDMLRRPADFFAGASDWHESMLRIADSMVVPESITCNGRLPLETVKAECVRMVKWLKNTAAATCSLAFQLLPEEEFLAIVSGQKLPGRLAKFGLSEIRAQLSGAVSIVSNIGLTLVEGTVATFTVDSVPAIA